MQWQLETVRQVVLHRKHLGLAARRALDLAEGLPQPESHGARSKHGRQRPPLDTVWVLAEIAQSRRDVAMLLPHRPG